jgi:hypothetical protein
MLPNEFTNGFTQVDREGEVVESAFVHDSLYDFIFSSDRTEMINKAKNELYHENCPLENLTVFNRLKALADEPMPPRHQWQTVEAGIIAVSHKSRSAEYRNQIGAQRAAPVIVCAQRLCAELDNKDYFFAGIARTKSVRPYDDGMGPTTDEMFTISLKGKVTMLNNGPSPIMMGDNVEWTFDDSTTLPDSVLTKRQKLGDAQGPRRIVMQPQTDTGERVFGRALNFAKRGERIDILLKN